MSKVKLFWILLASVVITTLPGFSVASKSIAITALNPLPIKVSINSPPHYGDYKIKMPAGKQIIFRIPHGALEQVSEPGYCEDKQILSSGECIARVKFTSPQRTGFFKPRIVACISYGMSCTKYEIPIQVVAEPFLEKIAITPENQSIPLGDTQKFTAQGTYSEGADRDVTNQVSWSSNDSNVAVFEDPSHPGVISSVAKVGPISVVAYDKSTNIKSSTQLTVTDPVLRSLKVISAEDLSCGTNSDGETRCLPGDRQERDASDGIRIPRGKDWKFRVNSFYSDGLHDTNPHLNWLSSDPSVATVENGVVTTLKEGMTYITVSFGNITSPQQLVIVTAPELLSIIVEPENSSIPLGRYQQFNATGNYTNGLNSTIQQLIWISSNQTVAEINEKGLAKSHAEGTTNITATSGNRTSQKLPLTVTSSILESIAISLKEWQLTAMGSYSYGAAQNITSQVTTWDSSDPLVATVSSGGLIAPKSVGKTIVTARIDNVAGSQTIEITQPVLESIAISLKEWQLTAMGSYSYGDPQNTTNQVTIWGSSDPSVATVSSEGQITPLKGGRINVTATVGNISGSQEIEIAEPSLASIEISPVNTSLTHGLQLTAFGTNSYGFKQNITTQVEWDSSNQSVATISSLGVVNPVGMGTTDITAAMLGIISPEQTLIVDQPILISITIDPLEPKIDLGNTIKLRVRGTYSDGSTQYITGSVDWSSTISAIATVDNESDKGLVTPVEKGITVITIKYENLEDSTPLFVTTGSPQPQEEDNDSTESEANSS